MKDICPWSHLRRPVDWRLAALMRNGRPPTNSPELAYRRAQARVPNWDIPQFKGLGLPPGSMTWRRGVWAEGR